MADDLDRLLAEVRACRRCVEVPVGRALPHEPRPIVRAQATARVGIFGQAPGTRVHQSGTPFLDPSGDRLRDWLQIDAAQFYDERRVAIVPMGFCFPGLDRHGSDLPPRRECAPAWRTRLLGALPQLEIALLIGGYAQRWHLSQLDGGARRRANVAETVADWRGVLARSKHPRLYVLPHPSWRNSAWLKRHPWFEAELLPVLRADVAHVLCAPPIIVSGSST